MNTITRVMHCIFNHGKDIVYRRSPPILISVMRISYRKIYLYECPFNIQTRLGLGVAFVAIHVMVPGSSLGKLFYLRFLAHLSRRLTGELIGYPWIPRPSSSVCRPFTFSNVFSSETAWPIKAKFYVEPPWEGGMKVYINGPGHDQDGRHAHIW